MKTTNGLSPIMRRGKMFNYYAEIKGKRIPIDELIYLTLMKVYGWRHQITNDRVIIIESSNKGKVS